jgi:hypothetical protein
MANASVRHVRGVEQGKREMKQEQKGAGEEDDKRKGKRERITWPEKKRKKGG